MIKVVKATIIFHGSLLSKSSVPFVSKKPLSIGHSITYPIVGTCSSAMGYLKNFSSLVVVLGRKIPCLLHYSFLLQSN